MKVAKDFGKSEAEDLKRLAAVRKAVGDDVEIFVDANNGYYAKQAIAMSRRFEEYNVRWFEEPVLADDIQGLAEISRATTIPVATGEHEYTKYGFKELIAQGGADIVQPDVGRVGGVTEWMKVAHLAHAFNLPGRPARRPARPPAPGLRHPEPAGGGVPRRLGGDRQDLLHRVPGAEERHVVAVPGSARPRPGARTRRRQEVRSVE